MADGVGRTLKPTKFGINPQNTSRVYPDAKPDEYGQVKNADRDRSRLGGNPNDSAELHNGSDKDASQRALHHSLGPGRNQASPGDHQHNGTTSKKIGPLEANPTFNPAIPESSTNVKYRPVWTCATSGASIRELLHNFIEFRDI